MSDTLIVKVTLSSSEDLHLLFCKDTPAYLLRITTERVQGHFQSFAIQKEFESPTEAGTWLDENAWKVSQGIMGLTPTFLGTQGLWQKLKAFATKIVEGAPHSPVH